MIAFSKGIAVVVGLAAFVGTVHAQDGRTELKRSDLTGTNMEVIVSVLEKKPGETISRHSHHGEEAFYVLEGATIELPNGQQQSLATGIANINARDVPHGGVKIVGDKTLKLLTVHIVDKGKPINEPAK